MLKLVQKLRSLYGSVQASAERNIEVCIFNET
jgi:hypothetical protein